MHSREALPAAAPNFFENNLAKEKPCPRSARALEAHEALRRLSSVSVCDDKARWDDAHTNDRDNLASSPRGEQRMSDSRHLLSRKASHRDENRKTSCGSTPKPRPKRPQYFSRN
jgi:hypothetical protein